MTQTPTSVAADPDPEPGGASAPQEEPPGALKEEGYVDPALFDDDDDDDGSSTDHAMDLPDATLLRNNGTSFAKENTEEESDATEADGDDSDNDTPDDERAIEQDTELDLFNDSFSEVDDTESATALEENEEVSNLVEEGVLVEADSELQEEIADEQATGITVDEIEQSTPEIEQPDSPEHDADEELESPSRDDDDGDDSDDGDDEVEKDEKEQELDDDVEELDAVVTLSCTNSDVDEQETTLDEGNPIIESVNYSPEEVDLSQEKEYPSSVVEHAIIERSFPGTHKAVASAA